MFIKHLIMVSAIAVSFFAVCGIAQAGDPKIYTGLGCTEVQEQDVFPRQAEVREQDVFPSDLEPYGENDVRYNIAGWAYNSSLDHSISVVCPTVRDHAGKPMERAYITVLNQTQEDVLCRIRAWDRKGSFVEASTLFVFPPNPEALQIVKSNHKDDDDAIGDNSLEFVPMLSNSQGYYTVHCGLPPAEEIADEDGPGTGITFKMAFIVTYMIEEVDF